MKIINLYKITIKPINYMYRIGKYYFLYFKIDYKKPFNFGTFYTDVKYNICK